jgi:hypothetical protein
MTARDTSGSESDSQDESSQWRQADKFSLDTVAVTSATGEPALVETTNGIALVSQSCDVVLPHRLNVQVAPIIELVGNDARAARDGKRSRYAHLPRLGDTSFADLDHVSTVAKTALAGKRVGEGVAGDDETRRFAAAIARRFGRFAFPDDVSDAMKALRDLVQSKATKPQSPFGTVLADVLELRAESKAWAAVASEVTLVFVLFPGALPTLPDDDPGARRINCKGEAHRGRGGTYEPGCNLECSRKILALGAARGCCRDPVRDGRQDHERLNPPNVRRRGRFGRRVRAYACPPQRDRRPRPSVRALPARSPVDVTSAAPL